MKVTGLAFVGIPVSGMRRAREFFEGVLGLKVAEKTASGQWIEYDLGNNTLAMASMSHEWRPSEQRAGAALEVESFEDAIKRLKDRHVPFAVDPTGTPCCRMAIVQDPDGNKIAIHKIKPPEER